MAQDSLPVARGRLGDEEALSMESEIRNRVLAAFDLADAAPWPKAMVR